MTVTQNQQTVVGIGEWAVSNDPSDVIITYGLGSCLAICIYDPVVQVGGLVHIMLPAPKGTERDEGRPGRYVDTGVPLLFKKAYELGAQKSRIEVKVAGGAHVLKGRTDNFQIGKRNFMALKKLLWKNGVLLKAHDVGGDKSRTVSIEVGSGSVIVKSDQSTEVLG